MRAALNGLHRSSPGRRSTAVAGTIYLSAEPSVLQAPSNYSRRRTGDPEEPTRLQLHVLVHDQSLQSHQVFYQPTVPIRQRPPTALRVESGQQLGGKFC